jgi:hypothetical protein
MIPKEFSELYNQLISLDEFESKVDERLSEFRQKQAMTPEKALLSRAELLMHEYRDNLRPISDLYDFVQVVLSQNQIQYQVRNGTISQNFVPVEFVLNRQPAEVPA